VSRALREEVVLRSVIRDILREAPYRGSSPVRLGAVQSPGMSVKQIISAVGFTAMSSAYTWMTDFCSGKHDNFPIIKSSAAAEALVRAKSVGDSLSKHNALFNNYKDTIASKGSSRVGNVVTSLLIAVSDSDLAASQALYDATSTTASVWQSGVKDITGLPNENKTKVRDLLVRVLLLYTNCDESIIAQKIGTKDEFLTKFPFKTREQYLKFMQDVTSNTHSTFQDGVDKQRQKLRSMYAGDIAVIDKACNDSMTTDKKYYDYAFKKIK
jgi:hypothetical protein